MKFRGQYVFLSNMYTCPVVFEGVVYPSVENAFQAAKAEPNERSVFTGCSPAYAKKLGRSIIMDVNAWNDRRIDVMKELLRSKFSVPLLGEKLINLKEDIIEENDWGDTFWGVCRGEGQNMLGKLLTEVRNELLAETQNR